MWSNLPSIVEKRFEILNETFERLFNFALLVELFTAMGFISTPTTEFEGLCFALIIDWIPEPQPTSKIFPFNNLEYFESKKESSCGK